MKYKLFVVDIESEVMVLAEDSRKAELIASTDVDDYSKLESASYFAREITSIKDINGDWEDIEPFSEDSDDPELSDISFLTCKEIMEKYEEEMEKNRLKAEQEKLQLKFNLGV